MAFSVFLGRLVRFNRALSGWLEWVGIAGLVFMMLVTGVDVVGAKVFNWRLMGALDMVMLAQVAAIAFALAFTLIIGRHVRVDFFLNWLPRRPAAIIDSAVHLLGLALFVLITWRLYALGATFQRTGEYSATIRIPYFPFAYGVAIAAIPVCLVLVEHFLSALSRAVEE